MKKQLPLLFGFISCFAINAQTTINTTSQIGYSAPLMIASSATASTVDITIIGASVTWNSSNLMQENGTPTVNFSVSVPSGTAFASDYPNANWYWTDPALSSVVGHHYYTLTADSLAMWGIHTTGQNYEIYDNPEMELKLPFSFNDNYVNTYSKTNYYANGSVSSYNTGTNTLTYDAYGTLILPNGTFNNVARIKNVRTNSLGPTTTSYDWYLISTGELLLNYETNGGLQVVYNNSVPSGIDDVNANNFSVIVSPNPFTTSSTLKINSSEILKNAEVKIYDVPGKEVKSIPVNSNEIIINRKGLENGIYFYSLINNQTIVKTGKLVVN